MPDQIAPDALETEEGRHATNLELFLDLVFVFAVTQVSGLFREDRTLPGFGRALLLTWLVWWLWSQFAWLGTGVELGPRSRAQYLVLVTVPLALLMAVGIPGAYGDTGLEFAGAYLAVNLWCLTIQGSTAWSSPANRAAFLRYAPLAAASPLVLFAGSFATDWVRVAIWTVVALLNVGGALAAGGEGRDGNAEWSIDPVHFAERHALFVIISLGEALVAIGASASAGGLTHQIGAGVVAAVAVTCVLWWIYFSYVPAAVEAALRRARGVHRGRVARDWFTFGHFPIVLGIVLYAGVAHGAAAHPTAALPTGERTALALGVASFIGGLAHLKWRAVRRVSVERVAGVAAAALWCVVAADLAATVVLVGLAVILGLTQLVTLRLHDRFEAEAAAGVADAQPGTSP